MARYAFIFQKYMKHQN